MPEKKQYRVLITQELEIEAENIEALKEAVNNELTDMIQNDVGVDFSWEEGLPE